MPYQRFFMILFLLSIFFVATTGSGHAQAGTTYYVSDSDGADTNTGLSQTPGTNGPFQTIGHVNSLILQPGDEVLFKCGDTWRGEMLIIRDSGNAANPIAFGSYPTADCADKPIISGAQPINGWTATATANIYQANLSAGIFPYGVNQLFRNNQRLPFGRWPNLNQYDAGYSTIDGQPSGNRITDTQLPGVNWTGAIAHIRGMRWYILNRQVTADSGSTLTLGANADCWGGDCTGWGFFLNNHLSTLDSEGEWYYDAAANRVYLYTTSGAPADNTVEGSVVLQNNDRSWGGILLGPDYSTGISYVTVDNFDVRRWFRNGIAAPTNFANYELHHITLQNNTISDVDDVGLNLAVWVYSAADGRPDGWRGGYNMIVTGNTIVRANSRGIDAYSRQSTFTNNTIQDVGLIENLGAAGMGCSLTTSGGGCTEDGDGIRIKIGNVNDAGNNNTVSGNRLERIAYNGIDVFGHTNTFANNVIRQACYAKGDCGGMRTFGNSNLPGTPVYDLTISNNIIVDIPGNTDGCNSTYKPLFGMGLYIDNYSRDVQITGNSVLTTTFTGILYQRSTGTANNNTVYNASSGTMYTGQINVGGSGARAGLNNNIMYGLGDYAWLLVMDERANITTSNSNYFFHPYEHTAYEDKKIIVGGWSGRRNLAEWQAFSGLDGSSTKHWFTQNGGDPPLSRVFHNETGIAQTINLGNKKYLDLDQNIVTGNITLPAYSSRVLIDDGLLLYSISPDISDVDDPQNFTLTVKGMKFTGASQVYWNGSPRTTTFVDENTLTAAINSSDVDTLGNYSVTVYDSSHTPYLTQTDAIIFQVVELSQVYLPVVLK